MALSSTVLVIGPTVSKELLKGKTPCLETRPKVGFIPTIPHSAEGIRIYPPVSLPRAPMHCPAATEDPEPPLEPPVAHSVFQGFLAEP